MNPTKPHIKRVSYGWMVIAPDGGWVILTIFSAACRWALKYGKPAPIYNEWGIPC